MRRAVTGGLAIVRAICGFLFAVAAAINVANVIGRYMFSAPIIWAEEILVQLMLWFVFLGAVLVTWNNAHLRMDLLSGALRGVPRRVLESITAAIVLGICALVAWIAFGVMRLMLDLDQRTVVAGLPVAISHGAIFAGFALMGLAAILRIVFVGIAAESSNHEPGGG